MAILYNCDNDQPTAGFDKVELRADELIVGCKCTRYDGMHHECRRAKCMGQPQCLAYPVATCLPSQTCQQPQPQTRDRHEATTVTAEPDRTSDIVDSEATEAQLRDARRRVAINRRLRKWAIAQYNDRPVPFRPLFEPCQVHTTAARKRAITISKIHKSVPAPRTC